MVASRVFRDNKNRTIGLTLIQKAGAFCPGYPGVMCEKIIFGKEVGEIGMKSLLSILILFSFFVSAASAQENCNSIITCQNIGKKQYDEGNYQEAIKYFGAQVDYAYKDKKHQHIAYNNLSIAHLKAGNIFEALAWAKVAIEIDPSNSSASFNKKKISKQIPIISWPPNSATFGEYAGADQWNTLKLKVETPNSIKFELSVARYGSLPTREYGPASYGNISGTATKIKGNYIYSTGDCHIEIEFIEDSYLVYINRYWYENNKRCQFGGHQIYAQGKYYLLALE